MKYYYTDPLAAAWMAKHFAMKFENNPTAFSYSFMHGDLAHYHEKYYIHSDSTPIMEPQIGDMVTNIGKQANIVDKLGEDVVYHANSTFTSKEYAKIIQRNGIAFMWPESEGV